MSSFKNAIPRRAHKERAQPESRKRFGHLEKHKDYVIRAKAYHQKEEALRRMKEKAALKNPDEFNFKMINSRMVDGVHKPGNEANQYSAEQLSLMKTQDIGYVLQKLQSEKKKVEQLTSTLHLLDHQPSNKRVYYVEDREEAKEVQARGSRQKNSRVSKDLPPSIKRKVAASYRELEARRHRVKELEELYAQMSLQKELQKKGRKRKLREDELVNPTSRPVYKWVQERKR